MKSESYILTNEAVKANAALHIRNIPADGKIKVTISSSGDKSARQRGLQWRWNTDVSKSGKGGKHEDTKEGVHLVSKYRWAIPILIRDDPFFADLHSTWIQLYGKDPDRMEWFVENQVHTEIFTVSQMAEFLTEYQRYYLDNGVELTNPDDLKLLMYEELNG